jgi:CHAD domain-containing protein
MPGKKSQHRFLKKRIKNVLQHLHVFSQTRSTEELHQLRVEMKRIKALVRFSADCLKKKKLKRLADPIQKIFKHAARIRNAHINLELTQGLSNKKFRADMNAIQLEQWRKFAALQDNYDKNIKDFRKKLLPNLQRVKSTEANKWYKKEIKKTGRLLNEGHSQLHNARKKLKRVSYMNELYPAKPKLNERYLEEVEDAIGKWHDVKLTLGVLKREGALNKKLSERLKSKQGELLFLIDHITGNFKGQVQS